MNHIVKRKGHNEPYDSRKIYASIYASCLAVYEPQATAELIAEKVVSGVEEWLEKKHEVTSHDIKQRATEQLQQYNPDAAYLYMTHAVIG